MTYKENNGTTLNLKKSVTLLFVRNSLALDQNNWRKANIIFSTYESAVMQVLNSTYINNEAIFTGVANLLHPLKTEQKTLVHLDSIGVKTANIFDRFRRKNSN